MEKRRKKKLEEKGWVVSSGDEFLGLTPGESRYLDLKFALMESLRAEREAKGVTQTELAKLVGSTQPRIAKMEGGDPSVSVDALLKALIALGVTKRKLAKIFE
jgi:predicted XRE-type DNA-binding protein